MKTEKTEKTKYPLSQIYFYLTEGCNLACRHCWIQPKRQTKEHIYPSLPPNLFQSIIEEAKPLGLAGVKLTGGEPLLHPQINDILDIIKSNKLRFTVETNGILCTPALAEKMKAACENPFISVSLDGADVETHEWIRGVKGSFEAVLSGIRNLVKAGFKPQIIMTVMRRNKAQMEALVRMAESLGAASVKFNVMQPTARGESMHKSGENLSIKELIELGKWVENELSASTKLRLFFHHPAAFKPLGKMFGSNGDGCGICGIMGILGVLSDGSYAMCGIGQTVPELVFGRAGADSLEDVWNNTSMLCEIREGLPKRLEGVCGDCLMKFRCLGSCIAQNYYRSKNLWAPFWYCEEALNSGRFPETRISAEKCKQ
jgi:SynChlorMet cassette radical SAM/SPASM protein ScmF